MLSQRSIAPHFMAQGTIDAMIETGMTSPSIRASYDAAGGEALKKLSAHLAFAGDAWLAWMKAAMHRHEEAADNPR